MLVKELSTLIFSVLKASLCYSHLSLGSSCKLWNPLDEYEVKSVTIEKDFVKLGFEQCNAKKRIDVFKYTDCLAHDDLVRVIEGDNIIWEGQVIELWDDFPEVLVFRKIKTVYYENRYSNGATAIIYIK